MPRRCSGSTPPPKGVQHTLLVEIPLEQLTFQENRRARTYALRFTAMALIKDSGGQVVQRFSESYPLEGPIDRLPALKRGRLRFKRQFSVAPGRYTLVTIARDQAAERSSVRSLPLAVPDPSQGIRISDLSIIRSVEPAGDAADSIEDPFRTGAIRVAPNLELADLEGGQRSDLRLRDGLSRLPAARRRWHSSSSATAP